MSKGRLPRVNIQFLMQFARDGAQDSVCWTKSHMYRVWRSWGSPETFTALDFLKKVQRNYRLSDTIYLYEALAIVAYMLPRGFLGFLQGRELSDYLVYERGRFTNKEDVEFLIQELSKYK